MLYYLLDLLERLYHPPGFGIVRYLTARAAAAAITALVISFWLGPVFIRLLRRKQIGEAAKLEAPKTHLTKAGTPTMGGLIVLTALIIPTMLWANLGNIYIVLILFVTVVLGGVGFLDDYLKVVKHKPKGLIGRYKVVGQVLVGLVLGSVIYFFPHWIDPDLWKLNTYTTVPFIKHLEFDFGRLYIPIVIFMIVATSNAVNYTITETTPGGTMSVTLTVAIVAPGFDYGANPVTYTKGVAITPNVPGGGSGAGIYSVSPPLPPGLGLNTSTGAITGTPTALRSAATYAVTKTTGTGSTAVGLSIAVSGIPISVGDVLGCALGRRRDGDRRASVIDRARPEQGRR